MVLDILCRQAIQPPDAHGWIKELVSIVIGIVSLIVGAYQVYKIRTRRRLEYCYLSNSPIVAVNAEVGSHVEVDIRVDTVSVRDPHWVVLSVKNSGGVSICETDYFEPLTFDFGTRVLSARVFETTPLALIRPQDVSTFLTLTSQSVQFPKFPLNPNNIIQVNVLLEGGGEIKVRGRINQGKLVERKLDVGVVSSSDVLIIVIAIVVMCLTIVLAIVLEGTSHSMVWFLHHLRW
jgi:hypothetical protein